MSLLNGRSLRRVLVGTLGFFILGSSSASPSWAQDVYVIYPGKDKVAKEQLVSALPSRLKVKSYNVNLLAIADYSAKQKILLKIQRAKIIIMLHDRTMEILDGTKVKKDLLIVQSSRTSVDSESWKAHIVGKTADMAELKGQVLKVGQPQDLADPTAIRSANVIVVDTESVNVYEAVSLVVQKVIAI